jgi:threonine dehydratase
VAGGVAAWYEGRVTRVAVEPESAPTLHRALEAGRPVDTEAGGIAMDSLAPRRVGTLVFPLAQRYFNKVVLVTDEAIREAQEKLWEKLRVVAEPGGATAFAAVSSGRYKPRAGERVGIILSGGNTVAVDFNRQG